jgi:hypothetical protein
VNVVNVGVEMVVLHVAVCVTVSTVVYSVAEIVVVVVIVVQSVLVLRLYNASS